VSLRQIWHTKTYSPFASSHTKRLPDALPFGRLWYGEPNAIDYTKFFSRSHDAVIRVYDDAGNVIETHEHKGDFRVF
jgi:hypothetical protein